MHEQRAAGRSFVSFGHLTPTHRHAFTLRSWLVAKFDPPESLLIRAGFRHVPAFIRRLTTNSPRGTVGHRTLPDCSATRCNRSPGRARLNDAQKPLRMAFPCHSMCVAFVLSGNIAATATIDDVIRLVARDDSDGPCFHAL